MLFNSFEFVVFLALVFLIYWKVLGKSVRAQNILLLISSYVFYGWWDWRFLFLLAFSSLVDYGVGIALDKESRQKNRKVFLFLSLLVNFGLLGVFKYYNFFAESLSIALQELGLQVNFLTLEIILPIGISFYTFQTVSYSIDIYFGRMKAEKDPVIFLGYVSFFPQLVAGPIERATNLVPQLKKARVYNPGMVVSGLRLILWGFFKKLVIADNCAPFVDEAFANAGNSSGLELILGAVFFAFQIYGDFSGYSDIAIGVARLLGIDLMTNFKAPYFSRNIAEFWRRWHISLSTWFRDYLYIPLGGSRGGTYQTIRNTLVIFLVSGFWHGANWTFIAWGALHALFFLPTVIWKKNKAANGAIAPSGFLSHLKEWTGIFLTFSLVTLAWIFFRAESIHAAIRYTLGIVTMNFVPGDWPVYSIPLIVGIGILLVFDWLGRLQGVDQYMGAIKHRVVRWLIYYFLILYILLFGSFSHTAFIYFQF